jgi:hypothetical protein
MHCDNRSLASRSTVGAAQINRARRACAGIIAMSAEGSSCATTDILDASAQGHGGQLRTGPHVDRDHQVVRQIRCVASGDRTVPVDGGPARDLRAKAIAASSARQLTGLSATDHRPDARAGSLNAPCRPCQPWRVVHQVS